MSALQVIWFVLIGVLLTGYAVLDGFDLGVGCWHLFSRKDEDRRAQLNAIAPVWDGNEVWLLTGGGAIFAAFPHVYATVFSGFYLALMLVLLGLILRAVSVEFRGKEASPRWRAVCDVGFAVGSILPALLFGVAIGNVLRGLPLDEAKNFTGSFFSLLNPYALLIGLTGLAMFATHGAVYLTVKTSGELAERAKGWAAQAWAAFLALFVVATLTTIVMQPHLLKNYGALPALWIVPVITPLCIVMAGVLNRKGRAMQAFLASALSIAGVMAMIAIGLFPNLVPALNSPNLSLTIMNASSSELTLKVMFILALLGMPLVLAYTAWVYYIFRGKVGAEAPGY
jgi:cytochrome d ubiquinol oxidase subunit II